jgi:RimJ/RimL family protein N-acetyltransferase
VQLTTDADNAAMRRVAEHLGFELEGTLRGFMPTKNGPRDYVMYGITRDGFDEARKVWNSTG